MPSASFDLPDSVLDAAMAALVDVGPDERRRVLADLVARFPDHREGLHALGDTLAAADGVLADAFGARAIPGIGANGHAPDPAALPRFDGYRIVRRLGEGAFGVVYLCDQLGPLPRQVAVKLLRPGAGDRGTLARFDAERRFLARLRHPAIAQIFDAGMLADGRPWFVMEHVAGVPITRWCDDTRLPVDARLRLFARLCQGVHHAHEQAIVHRDLKPSNVLVVEVDGEAQPKIIDFGVARALQPTPATSEDGGEGPRTETGRVVGTPGYMSPEQAAGRLLEVDARTDVWSLGVLLFELLTGSLPWGRHALQTDTDAPHPSHRLAADATQATTIAERRRSQPRRLAASVRGDLDWIVLKALARERRDRYATALELAADVQRHLRGEAVHAGPPSWRYRLRKFLRRRRAGVALAASLSLGTLVAMLVVLEYRSDAQAREWEAGAAVAQLLERANDPALSGTADSARLRGSLAKDALAFYEHFLCERPEHEASLEGRARTLCALSQVHWLLDQHAESARFARDAVAAAERWLARLPDDPARLAHLASAERNLGRALESMGRGAESQRHFQRVVDLLERCDDRSSPEARSVLVAAMLETAGSRSAEARAAVTQRAVSIQREICAAMPHEPRARADLANVLATAVECMVERSDLAGAEEMLRELERGTAGLPDRILVRVHSASAAVAALAGNRKGAVTAQQLAVEAARRWVAAEPHRARPCERLGAALESLADRQLAAGRASEHSATQQLRLELAREWAQRFPGDLWIAVLLSEAAQRSTLLSLRSGRRADAEGSVAPMREALDALQRVDDTDAVEHGRRQWRALIHLTFLADAVDLPDRAALWQASIDAFVAGAVGSGPSRREAPSAAIWLNRLVGRHLAEGRTAEAGSLLAVLDRLHEAHPDPSRRAMATAETRRLHAWHAARSMDWDTAFECVEDAATATEGWGGAVAAADAAHQLWTVAQRDAPEHAVAWCSRSLGANERAAARLAGIRGIGTEPALRLRMTRMLVQTAAARRALHGHDASTAAQTRALQRAVDDYASLQAIAHADEWDAAVLAKGRELLAR